MYIVTYQERIILYLLNFCHFVFDTIKGEIIHSVDYKDAITNGMVGKRALIVGIGNSAVDAAVDLATVGR